MRQGIHDFAEAMRVEIKVSRQGASVAEMAFAPSRVHKMQVDARGVVSLFLNDVRVELAIDSLGIYVSFVRGVVEIYDRKAKEMLGAVDVSGVVKARDGLEVSVEWREEEQVATEPEAALALL